jgi:hypothetical protein
MALHRNGRHGAERDRTLVSKRVRVDSALSAFCERLVFTSEIVREVGDTAGGYGIALCIPVRICADRVDFRFRGAPEMMDTLAGLSDGRKCRVGPGNFTPSLSQIPDVILSHHPARATARRLPPSAEIAGSSRFDPVGPRSTAMTHPLRSMGITPLHHYYEAVRPSPAHRYFQPHGWSRLCFFPWHRRSGSHVPYRSLVELRAAYTPDAARSVSGHPPS